MGLRFSEDGPDFPAALVDALLDGKVLFLCGAGVSSPQLPGFGELVTRVSAELGVSLSEGEKEAQAARRFEEVLGSMARNLANRSGMHEVVRRLLVVADPQLEKHATILRLSRNLDNRVALVTTNFDTFFERALERIAGKGSAKRESFAGQALPLPGADDFGGVIHLHGRLDDPVVEVESTPLVLTSAEYGEAYMRSGWASRFLFDLVRCKTLVLLGYSAGDAPVRYFLNVLEADRERFSDLQPVYALDAIDAVHAPEGDRWAPIAVRSLSYRPGRKGEADRHGALWRDLAALADLVEQPRAWRRRRAKELLAQPFDVSADLDLGIVEWLLAGKRDLWDVVITAVKDPRWFDYFTSQNLWADADAAWVLAAWCASSWTDRPRLEAAIPWRRRFGTEFAAAVQSRLASHPPQSALVQRAWSLVADERDSTGDGMNAYRLAPKVRSAACTDADLRAGVRLLTPRARVRDYGFRLAESDSADEPPQRLTDLVYVVLTVPNQDNAGEIAAALREAPGKARRIMEIATEELRATIALAQEIEFIGPGWDQLDSGTPTVEPHEQNEYRDGPVFLLELLSDRYAVVASEDPAGARRWATSCRDLPSQIGTRLYLNALRDARVFTADAVAAAVFSLSHTAFWTIRRELVLAMAERLTDARADLVEAIAKRVIAEAPDLYNDPSDRPEGKTDWRPQVRDRDVWLRLAALKRAGCLPVAGEQALAEIAARHAFISGDFTEADLFSAYSTGVRTIVGDPAPLTAAAAEERLPIARTFISAWDPETQRNWSAYCGADPGGALEALKLGEFQQSDVRLWLELIGALAWDLRPESEASSARPAIVRSAMEHLATAPEEFISQLAPRLVELLPVARKFGVVDVDGWWDRLWAIAERDDTPAPFESADGFYDRVINTAGGRLAEHLVAAVNAVTRKSRKITPQNRARLRRVMMSDTPAGWLGRAALVRDAGFTHYLDPQGCVRLLRPWIARDDPQGLSLRSVLVAFAQLSTTATRAYRAEILKAVVESQASGETAARAALALLRPLFLGALNQSEAAWGLRRDAVRDALKAASPSILEGAARAVRLWVTPTDLPPEQAWREGVKPVFEAVWPKERRYKRPGLTHHLAAACVDAGKAFPEAFTVMRHYLSPFEEAWNGLYFLTKSTAPETFPEEVLQLLWMICGPASQGQSMDLGKVLDRLAQAHAPLINDRRYQWLDQRAVRYD